MTVPLADVLLSIDAALASMHTARAMIEAYFSEPVDEDGRCKHLNREETFQETICRDCGETLPRLAGAPGGDGVASSRVDGPAS